MSSQLLILHDPNWNVRLARQNFDSVATCQSLGGRFDQADRLAHSLERREKFEHDREKSVMAAYCGKLMWIRQWYLTKVTRLEDVAKIQAPVSLANMATLSDSSLTNQIVDLDWPASNASRIFPFAY